MKNPQIRILPADFILSSSFFDYMKKEDKIECYNRVESGLSLVLGYEEEKYTRFAAIIDLDDNESIHVREVSGAFVNRIEFLEVFVTALAKVKNKNAVTFCTVRDGVEMLGNHLGFYRDENNVLIKRVN